jgi:hypothetical protein
MKFNILEARNTLEKTICYLTSSGIVAFWLFWFLFKPESDPELLKHESVFWLPDLLIATLLIKSLYSKSSDFYQSLAAGMCIYLSILDAVFCISSGKGSVFSWIIILYLFLFPGVILAMKSYFSIRVEYRPARRF